MVLLFLSYFNWYVPHKSEKGTLGDCTPALHNWCSRMTDFIKEESRSVVYMATNEIVSRFHKAIGWNEEENCLIESAPLAAATWDEILELSSEALTSCGIKEAPIKVRIWHDNLGDIHANDKTLISDLPGYMRNFRNQGYLIAICTSDDRKATDACIKNWGLSDLIDVSYYLTMFPF